MRFLAGPPTKLPRLSLPLASASVAKFATFCNGKRVTVIRVRLRGDFIDVFQGITFPPSGRPVVAETTLTGSVLLLSL